MLERTFALPQTITITLHGSDLLEAVNARYRPWMKDPRDDPGIDAGGISRLDRRYDGRQVKHPVPSYGPAPSGVQIRPARQSFVADEGMDIIQATTTPMSPLVASAFVDALAEDPSHPFVTTHIAEGFDLNGSDSYLKVGGAALAVPLAWLHSRSGRPSKDAVEHPPEGADRDLDVHVYSDHKHGVAGADFLAAAQRHATLDPDEIVIGNNGTAGIEPISHGQRGTGLTGNEIPKFKLVQDGRTAAIFDTAEAASEALFEAMSKIGCRDSMHLSRQTYRDEFLHKFTVQSCLVEDGAEVQRDVEMVLREAKAVVKATVATVPKGAGGPVEGWLLVWSAEDWHRNKSLLTQYLDGQGNVIGRRYGW